MAIRLRAVIRDFSVFRSVHTCAGG